MELDCEKERDRDGEHASVEDPWPCVEIFKTVAELNEQCLELLVQQASVHVTSVVPILRELRQLWCRLDPDSRKRAAACPYVLFDAGFSDPYCWRWAGRHRVEDREPNALASFFTVPGIGKLAHQVFTNAWYMARTQPVGVPLFLGMPAGCAALIRTCSMRQITELAEQHAGWLRPRWAGRVTLWRELLLAALSADEAALEKARLQGVQLLATELRALDQVTAAERR